MKWVNCVISGHCPSLSPPTRVKWWNRWTLCLLTHVPSLSPSTPVKLWNGWTLCLLTHVPSLSPSTRVNSWIGWTVSILTCALALPPYGCEMMNSVKCVPFSHFCPLSSVSPHTPLKWSNRWNLVNSLIYAFSPRPHPVPLRNDEFGEIGNSALCSRPHPLPLWNEKIREIGDSGLFSPPLSLHLWDEELGENGEFDLSTRSAVYLCEMMNLVKSVKSVKSGFH